MRLDTAAAVVILAIAVLSVSLAADSESPAPPGATDDRPNLMEFELYVRSRWNMPRLDRSEVALTSGMTPLTAGYVRYLTSLWAEKPPVSQSSEEGPPLQTTVPFMPHNMYLPEPTPTVEHPTLYTSECIRAIAAGDLPLAERYARFMLKRMVVQDGAGFWYFTFDLRLGTDNTLKAPWPSSLSQGLGLVAFAALNRITGRQEYREAAQAVFRSFLVPVEKGGFARITDTTWWPEECPSKALSGILNGGAVGLVALHDYWVLESDPRAKQLFGRGIHTLEEMLPRYETVTPAFTEVVSTYSLVPRVPMVLARILPRPGNCYVSRFALLANGDPLSEVVVGSTADADRTQQSGYIWYDGVSQMWGDREQYAGRPCRDAGGLPAAPSGHAPVSLRCPTGAAQRVSYALAVEYRRAAERPARLEAYDGARYWPLVELPPTAGNWRTVTAELPGAFVARAFAQDTAPPVDSHYIDDNSTLVLALADLSGSEKLRHYGLRWLSSTADVPYRFVNNSRGNLFGQMPEKPALAMARDETMGSAGYPTAIAQDENRLMMWWAQSATGQTSRVVMAASDDGGNTWTRHGPVFPDVSIPEWASGNQGFPFIYQDVRSTDPARRFRMYFSAAGASDQTYSALGLSYSADGLSWSEPELLVRGEMLDPSVVQDATGVYHLYYTTPQGTLQALSHAVSPDGEHWSKAVILRYYPAAAIGSQTLYSVAAFSLGPYIMVLYTEQSAPGDQVENLMFSRDGRGFVDVLTNPVSASPTWEPTRWDTRRYGWSLLPPLNSSGKAWRAFYTGVDASATPLGQIGMIEADPDAMLSAVRETLAMLAP